MEIGRVADIDNAKLNNIEKVQKINNVDDKNKVIQDDEYKKTLGSEQVLSKNEVMLDNVKFGYNKSSKDFFIKITRAEAEYKYPTEDMMKVKAFILQELENRK
ncbi:flagellin [Poseidonibacter lekithochrous]|uniref:flagellin n=1 Tax=Poseidonibacter TaxID=2321187 RepID=UPI001C0A28C1|nr:MULTISPECIES: flagellin [Poseidonibacter]MBU3015509.1 flagellin [Poseidonibacter lekithochrous]MDO6828808.1 flagellin [Poseidonibacter sp. 1_MG-2023]